MNSFLRWLAGNSLIRAQILGVARHVASSIAGAIGLWLASHGADQSMTTDATQGIILLLSAAASYGLSIWDKDNVDDKIKTAAATGANSEQSAIIAAKVDQAAADSQKVAETVATVKEAIQSASDNAPKSMNEVLDNLAKGKG